MMKTQLIFKKKNGRYQVYCPMCDCYFEGSDYLKKVFKDNEKALWLANMVTHYRHDHITSWNKCWGYGGRFYRKAAHFGDYDDEKKQVNERAKRQIARKCSNFLIMNGIDESIFLMLQNTEEKTLEVVRNIFRKPAA